MSSLGFVERLDAMLSDLKSKQRRFNAVERMTMQALDQLVANKQQVEPFNHFQEIVKNTRLDERLFIGFLTQIDAWKDLVQHMTEQQGDQEDQENLHLSSTSSSSSSSSSSGLVDGMDTEPAVTKQTELQDKVLLEVSKVVDEHSNLLKRRLAKIQGLVCQWVKYFEERSMDILSYRSLRDMRDEMIQSLILQKVDQETHQLKSCPWEHVIEPWIQAFGVDAVASAFSALTVSKQIEFPYKRGFMTSPDILMDNLRKMYRPMDHTPFDRIPNIHFETNKLGFTRQFYDGQEFFPLTFGGEYTSFVSEPEDYNNMDVIVDFFNEDQRLKARRQDQKLSPLEMWVDPSVHMSLFMEMLTSKANMNINNIREFIFNRTSIKECTQFKPSLTKAIIKMFNARRMLDISAGWGDRLTGAIAADVHRYVATDPNINLKRGHSAIIDRFVPEEKRDRFQIM